jgi:hypothetical protein
MRLTRVDARIVRIAAVALLASGCARAPVDPVGESPPSAPLAQGSTQPGSSASFEGSSSPANGAGPELLVACDGTSTQIPEPVVRTQPDGFHVRFDNTSGRDLEVAWSDRSGTALSGDTVPASGLAFVMTMGVGDYQVACGGPPIRVTVVDPDRLYTPAVTWCESQSSGGSGSTGTLDYGPDALGLKGDVVNIARTKLSGLALGDVVEHAGYPRAAGVQSVRVVRLGRVVAVLDFEADGRGGWLLAGTHACEGSGIDVKA